MTVKYVGADVHKSTTTIVVKNDDGKTLRSSVMETSEEQLTSEIQAISGTIEMTFEESPYATWLWDMLRPYVSKLIVCNPRHNQLISNQEKNDKLDAEALADLLRAGLLKSVYHGEQSKRDLKELVKSYDQLLTDRTRTKNRITSLFASRGVKAESKQRYTSDPEVRNTLIEQLPGAGLQQRVRRLYAQLDLQQQLVKEARKAMLDESENSDGVKHIKTIPGFGPIRAAQLVGWVQTPHRFRNKRQFRKYVGLAVVTNTSSDWEVTDSGLRRKQQRQTRGLNQDFHHPLKNIIKGASKDAIAQDRAWNAHFNALVDDGMRQDLARLTIARKLASTALSLWKRGVDYAPQKAVLRS